MGEIKPPSAICEQRFGIHTELDQRRLAKEAGIFGHLPRNNEQAIFLELISRINLQSEELWTRVGVPGAISFARNIDYQVIAHPYNPLVDIISLSDIFDQNIAVAREKNQNRALYSQLQETEYYQARALLLNQPGGILDKFSIHSSPNGLYYTVNPHLSSHAEGTPRVSLSLSPKEGPEVALKIIESILEYLKTLPDLYMQFKLYESEPFGFGDDLHIYFNQSQEAHVYQLLSQHLYPAIESHLLGGGRTLALPVYDANGYQMRGVQFGQPLLGLSTSHTADRLITSFLGYFKIYGGMAEIRRQLIKEGHQMLRHNPFYLSAASQTSIRLSENSKKTDPNNVLVPTQFETRFPVFSTKTRFREMKPLP